MIDPEDIAFKVTGNIIRQAIYDFKSEYLKRTRPSIWDDARSFLFDHNRLEKLLKKFLMEDKINCRLIRKRAKDQGFEIEENI